ncbi:hypothetical protein AbraIFM66950_007541 [Aspergillus brasiliensis]|nr:hypothetical protein AbraIFM66950_007541 [Aspergillus brasiliensis]
MPVSRLKKQDRPKHADLDTRKRAMRAGTKQHRKKSNHHEQQPKKGSLANLNNDLLTPVTSIDMDSPHDTRRTARYSCPPDMSADSVAFLSPEETPDMSRLPFMRQALRRDNHFMPSMQLPTPEQSHQNEESPRRSERVAAAKDHTGLKSDKALHDLKQPRRSSHQLSTTNSSSHPRSDYSLPDFGGSIRERILQRRTEPYSQPRSIIRPSRIQCVDAWFGRLQEFLQKTSMVTEDQSLDGGIQGYHLTHSMVSYRKYPFEEINFTMLVFQDVSERADVNWNGLQAPLKHRLAHLFNEQNVSGSRRPIYGALVVGQLAQFYVFASGGPAQLNLSIFEENKVTLHLEHDQALIDAHLAWMRNEFPAEVFEAIANDPGLQEAAVRATEDLDIMPETVFSPTFEPLPERGSSPKSPCSDSEQISEETFETVCKDVLNLSDEDEDDDEAAEEQYEAEEPEDADEADESDVAKESDVVEEQYTSVVLSEEELIRQAISYVKDEALDRVIGTVNSDSELGDETDDEQKKYVRSRCY